MNIRIAGIEDRSRIVEFLKDNWNSESILVKSKVIFDFQYCWNGSVNFVIAEDNNEIIGVKGFIPFNNNTESDIAVALAFVKKGKKPLLGMEMEKFLEKNLNCRFVCSTGLNKDTSYKVYELFKRDYYVGTLEHFYQIGNTNNFVVARINNQNRIKSEFLGCGAEFIFIDSVESLKKCYDVQKLTNNKPFKSYEYLQYRYFQHPVYKYKVLGIKFNNKVQGVLFGREVEQCKKKVFRIVDFIGDKKYIQYTGLAFKDFINLGQYEYIDVYSYGVSEEIWNQAGFIKLLENDENIIPNYFEPYIQKNIDINFFFVGNGTENNVMIFKADGDQDRPNVI